MATAGTIDNRIDIELRRHLADCWRWCLNLDGTRTLGATAGRGSRHVAPSAELGVSAQVSEPHGLHRMVKLLHELGRIVLLAQS